MIKRLKNNNFEPPFLLFFCTVILLFFVSIISANFIFKIQNPPVLPTNNTVQNKIYFNSVPEPDQILVSNPVNIVINFKTRLTAGSQILLLKNSKKINLFPTTLDIDQMSMRQIVDPNLPDGGYNVIYKSCTALNVCDNGNFNFYINRKMLENYTDLLNNNETAITINKGLPYPKNVKISAGSSVVWINHDVDQIAIHSNPAPQNNYFLILNSPLLGQGGNFRAVFAKPGFYSYHIDSGLGNFISGMIVVQ